MAPELATVADDAAVAFDGTEVYRLDGLQPATAYRLAGVEFTTLPRPGGQCLATVATVNDVHFGETAAGHFEGMDVEPVLRAAPGAPPYPLTMNGAAAAEMETIGPDVVIAKGDLTAAGRPEEFAAFDACYRARFGDRLMCTLGNHDKGNGTAPLYPPVQERRVPGAVLAVLDTAREGHGGGFVSADQLEWLDELASRAEAPVLVFGHHPVWEDGVDDWLGQAAAINPADSAGMVEVFARRRALIGYFAGHTHRNRVRRFPASGPAPFVEVACTKDFPGTWAEYRIFEGGALQIHHRIAEPAALAWSERCRSLFFGMYPKYALGDISDRCFVIPMR